MKYYINLTAGLQQERYKGTFCRIQSSHLESHQFDRMFYGLSDDLLYNLALGNDCLIVDCSSNTIGKVIKRGIPIIMGVLKFYWFDVKDKNTLGLDYLNRILMTLSKQTKAKIRFYKKFLKAEHIALGGVSVKVNKEQHNDK